MQTILIPQGIYLWFYVTIYQYLNAYSCERIIEGKIDRGSRSHAGKHGYVGRVVDEGRTRFDVAHTARFRVVGRISHADGDSEATLNGAVSESEVLNGGKARFRRVATAEWSIGVIWAKLQVIRILVSKELNLKNRLRFDRLLK